MEIQSSLGAASSISSAPSPTLPDSQAVTVVVCRARPASLPSSGTGSCGPTTPAGQVRFEHRNEPRTEITEMFAVHTPEELMAVIDRIEGNCRGKSIGEQMLAEAQRARL
jgi:hypothetical protein